MFFFIFLTATNAQQSIIDSCSACVAGEVCHTLREDNVLKYQLQCEKNDETSCRHEINSQTLTGCPLSNYCEESIFASGSNDWDCVPYRSWATWSTWSTCSVSCGLGSQIRQRVCQNGVPGEDGCSGQAQESKQCNPPCSFPVETCQEWQEWSTCSDSSCQANQRERCRQCTGQTQCENDDGNPTTTSTQAPTTKTDFSTIGLNFNTDNNNVESGFFDTPDTTPRQVSTTTTNKVTTTTTRIITTTSTTTTAATTNSSSSDSCPFGQVLNESTGNCDLTTGSIAAIAVVLSLLVLSVIWILICFLCGCCGCVAKPCSSC